MPPPSSTIHSAFSLENLFLFFLFTRLDYYYSLFLVNGSIGLFLPDEEMVGSN